METSRPQILACVSVRFPGSSSRCLTREEWDRLDLVVAGDLVNRGQERWHRALSWLGRFIDPARIHAFLGNHELYGQEIDREARLANQTEAAGARWALRAEIITPGRSFLCCTPGTDMALGGDPVINRGVAETRMNDYRAIRVAAKTYWRLHAADTVALQREHGRVLEARPTAPFDGGTVVATHLAPYLRSLGRCDGGPNKSVYASDLRGLIEEHRPSFRVPSRTHVASDVMGGVRGSYAPQLATRPA